MEWTRRFPSNLTLKANPVEDGVFKEFGCPFFQVVRSGRVSIGDLLIKWGNDSLIEKGIPV